MSVELQLCKRQEKKELTIGYQVQKKLEITNRFANKIISMIDLSIHEVEVIKKEILSELRKSQSNHSYIIPSDYVFFLLNYGKMKFEKVPFMNYKDDFLEFFEFYDLENLEWQVNQRKKLLLDFKDCFWGEEYLCVGELVSKKILIGVAIDNVNQMYLIDDDEAYIEKISENIFSFINEKLIDWSYD
jgi:hypothetical protein